MKIDFKKLLGVVKQECKDFSYALALGIASLFIWILFVNLFNL